MRSRLLRTALAPWFPSFEIPWAQAGPIEKVLGGIPFPGSTGLALLKERPPGRSRLVFWCGRRKRKAILEEMTARGVMVIEGGRVW